MRLKDLSGYPPETEILIEGEGGIPLPPGYWDESVLIDEGKSRPAIVLYPADEPDEDED